MGREGRPTRQIRLPAKYRDEQLEVDLKLPEELYCVCRKPYEKGVFMIACDAKPKSNDCYEWCHGSCIGITEQQAENIQHYVCGACENKVEGGVITKTVWKRHPDTVMNTAQTMAQNQVNLNSGGGNFFNPAAMEFPPNVSSLPNMGGPSMVQPQNFMVSSGPMGNQLFPSFVNMSGPNLNYGGRNNAFIEPDNGMAPFFPMDTSMMWESFVTTSDGLDNEIVPQAPLDPSGSRDFIEELKDHDYFESFQGRQDSIMNPMTYGQPVGNIFVPAFPGSNVPGYFPAGMNMSSFQNIAQPMTGLQVGNVVEEVKPPAPAKPPDECTFVSCTNKKLATSLYCSEKCLLLDRKEAQKRQDGTPSTPASKSGRRVTLPRAQSGKSKTAVEPQPQPQPHPLKVEQSKPIDSTRQKLRDNLAAALMLMKKEKQIPLGETADKKTTPTESNVNEEREGNIKEEVHLKSVEGKVKEEVHLKSVEDKVKEEKDNEMEVHSPDPAEVQGGPVDNSEGIEEEVPVEKAESDMKKIPEEQGKVDQVAVEAEASVEQKIENVPPETETIDSSLGTAEKGVTLEKGGVEVVRIETIEGGEMKEAVEEVKEESRSLVEKSAELEDAGFDEKAKEISERIEEAMFKAFGGLSKKYKEKARSLLFNLKDPANPELRQKVMSEELLPEQLCQMSAEQLANRELSEWRTAKAEAREQQIVVTDELASKWKLVKKTHKGEVVVEGDNDLGGGDVAVDLSVRATAAPVSLQKSSPEKVKIEQPLSLKESTVDVVLESSSNSEWVKDGVLPQEIDVEASDKKGSQIEIPVPSFDEFEQKMAEETFERDNVPRGTENLELSPARDLEELVIQKVKGEAVKEDEGSDLFLWKGKLQSSGGLVGISFVYRSGERLPLTDCMTSVLEIKGTVKMDALDDFLFNLKFSSSRYTMIVHVVETLGKQSEKEAKITKELIDNYVLTEKAGIIEMKPGSELYLLPAGKHSESILEKCGHSGSSMEALIPTETRTVFLGALIRRKTSLPASWKPERSLPLERRKLKPSEEATRTSSSQKRPISPSATPKDPRKRQEMILPMETLPNRSFKETLSQPTDPRLSQSEDLRKNETRKSFSGSVPPKSKSRFQAPHNDDDDDDDLPEFDFETDLPELSSLQTRPLAPPLQQRWQEPSNQFPPQNPSPYPSKPNQRPVGQQGVSESYRSDEYRPPYGHSHAPHPIRPPFVHDNRPMGLSMGPTDFRGVPGKNYNQYSGYQPPPFRNRASVEVPDTSAGFPEERRFEHPLGVEPQSNRPPFQNFGEPPVRAPHGNPPPPMSWANRQTEHRPEDSHRQNRNWN